MMKGAGTLDSHFNTRKRTSQPAAPAKATRSASAVAKREQTTSAAATGPHTDDYLSEDEKVLRAFDLSSKYGPCTGMTRLQRWERAHKFGLDPPQEVHDILTRLAADDPSQHNIWHNRV